MSRSIRLALDCSQKRASVAVAAGEEIAELIREEEVRLETFLPRAFSELSRRFHFRPDEVTDLRVIDGPGSFTGLRGQMAFLKGLFFTRSPRAIQISGFEILYLLARREGLEGEFLLIPAFDRLGFYVQLCPIARQSPWLDDGSAGYMKNLAAYDSYPRAWSAPPPLALRNGDRLLSFSAATVLTLDSDFHQPATELELLRPNYFKSHYAEI